MRIRTHVAGGLGFPASRFQFRPVMVAGSASKGDHTTSPDKCAQWCARRGRETAFADGGNISYDKAEACSVSARRCRSKTTSKRGQVCWTVPAGQRFERRELRRIHGNPVLILFTGSPKI